MSNKEKELEIEQNIIDYLSDAWGHNHVRGFSELTGYWKSKHEVLEETSLEDLRIFYNIISDKFSTVEQVKEVLRSQVNEKLKQFAKVKRGRKSSYELTLRKLRRTVDFESKSKHKFLQRMKLLAGSCIGAKLDEVEIGNLIHEVIDSEINSKVYGDNTMSVLSNIQFRLGKLYSFMKNTEYGKIVTPHLKENAQKRLSFHRIDLDKAEDKIEKLSEMYAKVLEFKKEFEEIDKLHNKLKERLDTAMKVYYNESSEEMNGLSISEITKLKEYLND